MLWMTYKKVQTNISAGKMAFTILALMTMVTITGAFDWESRCTAVTSLTGQLTYKSRQTNEVVVKTAINTNMKLGETLCFKLEKIEKPEETDTIISALKMNKTSLMYQLKLSDVKQVHPIHNHYKFVIPSARREKCYCDCPCYADAKLHEQNYCSGVAEPCVQFWKADQTDNGCDGTFLCGHSNSEARCSFSIRKSTTHPEIYRGIEIGSSTTWAHFFLDVYNLADGTKIGNTVSLATDLSEGQQIHFDDRLSGVMSVASPGESTIIPSSWYFLQDNERKVYTGIEVNALNDYNLDKLGWLRWTGGNIVFPNNLKDTLQHRFSYSYSNCGDDHLSWDFSGRFTENDFDKATKSELGKRYANHLRSVQANGRNVEANLKTSSRMTIFLEFEETSDIIFFEDESILTDFSADFKLDKFSNKFLNFSMSQSAGSLVGFVRFTQETNQSDFKFSTYVDSLQPIDTAVQVGLPTRMACQNGTYSICLRSVSQKTYICRVPVAYCEKLQDFVLPEWKRQNDTGGDGSVGSFGEGLKKFFEHINPVRWIKALIDNIGDLFGWLGFVSNVIIILIIIVIIKVLMSKFCPSVRLCPCLGKKSKKETYEMVRP